MRDYLGALQASGELLVVEREIDPKMELAAVAEAIRRRFGKPILFRRVRGTPFPVATNLYGDRRRLAGVLGVAPDDLERRWSERIAPTGDAPTFSAAAPGDAAYREIRLSDLPQIVYSDGDAGPYLTSAIFLARDPASGAPNMSFHRSMIVDDCELRVRISSRRHLAGFIAAAEAKGKALEAAILIGPPPPFYVAAAAPVAEGGELKVATKLAGAPVPMLPCRRVALSAPAAAEIVVEGRFLPGVRRPEGPFGDFLGYYGPRSDAHVFQVDGVWARPGATFHSVSCGAPEENLFLETAVAARIHDRLAATLSGVLDVRCALAALHAVVRIRQAYDGHGLQVARAALDAAPEWLKACAVVDEDVDVDDPSDVAWAVATRARLERATLTPSGSGRRDPHGVYAGRLAVDATAPFASRSAFRRKRPPSVGDVDLDAWLAPVAVCEAEA